MPNISLPQYYSDTSAKSSTSYYRMGVQISKAVKAGTGGDVIVVVEETQGAVQSVIKCAVRGDSYVFTTPSVPGVRAAQAAPKKFPSKSVSRSSLFLRSLQKVARGE